MVVNMAVLMCFNILTLLQDSFPLSTRPQGKIILSQTEFMHPKKFLLFEGWELKALNSQLNSCLVLGACHESLAQKFCNFSLVDGHEVRVTGP